MYRKIENIVFLQHMKALALILALYMSLGSFFPQADFSQLPKVIYAFQHFQQHRQLEAAKGRTVSMWKFVEVHFFCPNEHGRGHEQEHSQLPLHSIGNSFAPVEFHHVSLPELALVKNFHSIFTTDQLLDLPGFLTGIFRPPIKF